MMPKIVLVATGGTIAMAGGAWKRTARRGGPQ